MSKACASKVRVGKDFVTQVLVCGITLSGPRLGVPVKCRVAESSCCDPTRPARSSTLQGDVHRVVLTCAQCMGLLRTGLLRRRCAAVCYCSPRPPAEMLSKFGVAHGWLATNPVSECQVFARIICRVLSGRMPGARVSCIAPAPPCADVCPRRPLLALRVCHTGSQRFRCPIVILLPG